MEDKAKQPPDNFEAGIAELEELVEAIERGDMSLEKSMDMCSDRLSNTGLAA